MQARRWLVVAVLLAAALVAGARFALPGLVRHVAIAGLEAMTHRRVRIDRLDCNIFTGRLAIDGFHVADRTPGPDLTDFDRLDVRLSLPSLLRGHLRIREAVLRGPTVRIVRLPAGLNVSDLLQNTKATGRAVDVTIDRFTLVGGMVTLEDRALAEPRTWVSKDIHVEARDVSTRHDRGIAEASSLIEGAPVTVALSSFRLYPIHLQAAIEVSGLDLSVSRLYLPASVPVVVEQGRASTSLRMTLDAREGVRAAGTGRLENVALVKRATGERLLVMPSLTTRFTDFAYRDDRLALTRVEVNGAASVLNPAAQGRPRFETSGVRASITDLTWPVESHARIELVTSVPGGGSVTLTGAVRPPPDPSQLRLRLARVSLAPWAQFLPTSAAVTGQVESDLRMNEPLRAGVPAHLRGSIAVNDLSVRDGRRPAVAARRIEATGLEVHWPGRLSVKQVALTSPHGVVERDKAGELSFRRLWRAPEATATAAPTPAGARAPGAAIVRSSSAVALAVSVGEIVIRNGRLSWRDATVTPSAGLDFAAISGRVTGVTWPLSGPLDGRIAARPPGGGRLEAQGRVAIAPLAGDIHVRTTELDLAPYQPYVPTPASVSGWANAELVVHLPRTDDERITVRGTAALSRVDVRDQQRSILKLERGVATEVDVVWPERVTVHELALRRPWALVERDERGAFTLPSLLWPSGPARNRSLRNRPTPDVPTPNSPAPSADGSNGTLAFALRQLVVEEGGARVVDRSLAPPFAVDLSRLAVKAEGLATTPGARAARITVRGRVGTGSLLDLEGTIGPLGGPLRVDVSGHLREFWMPRTDPYLLRYVGWEVHDGFLTTAVRCRIERDALDAASDIRLSRLVIAKASADEAQKRIGLPLGLIVALMKDSRGDINISLPVGGRLGDPRFDYSEALWSTVRNAAIKAILLPVSWIGRVHFTPDSRIERIQVDPVEYVPGTATFTPAGDAQVARLMAFLDQAPASRMMLTPAVSPDDIAALKRGVLDLELKRLARGAAGSKESPARRLFRQRFPERPPPESDDAVLAALLEATPLPPGTVAELAAQRVEAVRGIAKKGGVDRERLPDAPLVEGPDAARSQVALDIADPGPPERPKRGITDFLRRLGPKADGTPGGERSKG